MFALPTPPLKLVLIVGAGGTGSILAEHIARLIAGYRLATALAICDGDRVVAANVGRQNFHPHEVGAYKAEALATRLAGQFALEVFAIRDFLSAGVRKELMQSPTLAITCTDTLASRKIVADKAPRWWLDVGNELTHGQAIFGTTHDPRQFAAQCQKFRDGWHGGYVSVLPDIAAINAAILAGAKEKPEPACGDAPFAQQAFGVNAAAALAAAMIAKQALVDHLVKVPQIYFDLARGQMVPRPITAELFAPWKDVKLQPAKPAAEQDEDDVEIEREDDEE